jgi:hypothetical protein
MHFLYRKSDPQLEISQQQDVPVQEKRGEAN